MTTIGIIGGGFVGKAVARGFMEFAEIRIYDIKPEVATHSLTDTANSDFVFVCLPTPMKADGTCDLSILNEALAKALPLACGPDTVFVIKSTVPIGTTRRLAEEYGGRTILHSPEFLTARCSLVDFQTPARNIVGLPDEGHYYRVAGSKLRRLYEERFPGVQIFQMSSDESELVKYTCNSFFATKVAFFNEIHLLAKVLGLNFHKVLAGVLADGRIAHAHTAVPGPDGDMGFGGTCLPKDINALMTTMRENGMTPRVTAGAWDLNQAIRKKRDWEIRS